jgi:hypothetical protein
MSLLGDSGKHLLAASISPFDPKRLFADQWLFVALCGPSLSEQEVIGNRVDRPVQNPIVTPTPRSVTCASFIQWPLFVAMAFAQNWKALFHRLAIDFAQSYLFVSTA